MPARVFAIPDGPAKELVLVPRLESWEHRDHRDQVALREFVAHVRDLIDPVMEATPGELAFRLDVGLRDEIDPLWHRDLDNYLCPIARGLPERVISIWGTKGRAVDSRVRVEPALEVPPPAGWQEFVVLRRPRTERSWKEGVRKAVAGATELPEGPVALQLGFSVGLERGWTGMWKPSIDGLEPLLGSVYPNRDWNPQDGRVVRLGFHRGVDASIGHDAAMTVWARPADPNWPELRWLASMDQAQQAAFLDQHRSRRGTWTSNRRPVRRSPNPAPRLPAVRDDASVADIEEFRGDDDSYLRWVEANPGGYVVNISAGREPIRRSLAPRELPHGERRQPK